MKLNLLVLPFVAPILAAPIEELVDDIAPLEGRGYVVPNNITIDAFGEIDPTIMGIRLAENLEADNPPTFDAESSKGGIEARGDKIETNFFLGSKRAEFGCDQMVRPIIQKAVDALCRDQACDEGSSYYEKIKWSKQLGTAYVKVDVSGMYHGDVKQKLADAAKSTVVKNAFTSYEKQWRAQVGMGGGITQKCEMTRFPNFIQIDRRVDGDLRDQLKVTFTPPEEEEQDLCMLGGILKEIAASMGGIAGGFFGAVSIPGC